MRIRITVCLFFLIHVVGCKKDDVKASNNNENFVFGHLDSFRTLPDVLYKMEDDVLYTTHRVADLDPANPPVFYKVTVTDSLLTATKALLDAIPDQLLQDKATTVGTYFPDVGHAYLQVKKDNQVQHWYIEAKDVPDYLKDFESKLENILNKLPD